ncbi:MAG: PAS-domain containing protein [Gammaproteobacteria bacterium]|nr:PAS-domain containing protein [Gammaproteobacteria bacterium]MBU1554734.1 PAS-domain containing protein [Gammaproteobacteria bacterium]MBU2070121.1 PAS-domain containing protein [Gammaproteobacteria bacterium]MBU2183117.1 PAS-domain containing protein [Gammaproteobacteria bacterium]MBU2205434.1 PAS-domain containing protein [Gammaproteobacteria bacterium]
MAAWVVALLALLYVGGLFLIANWGERHADDKLIRKYGGVIYSLALAVYCTSWTYYGAVGTAVTQGWDYIPIYLGPVLLFIFAQPFLFKLLYVTKKQNVTSIADFIAARYGKRKNIALLASLVCLVVVVPYIALQLKAVSSSYQVLLGGDFSDDAANWWQDSAFLSALAMAFFAILFGTRKLHLTEQSRGVMVAIAFESVVKLFALLTLGLAVYVFVLSDVGSVFSRFADHAIAQQDRNSYGVLEFITKTVLATTAVFLLPRQFHVAFVENVSHHHLRHARRWFSLYLFMVTIVVIPIAIGGMQLFPQALSSADSFVLKIPAQSGWDMLSVLVFIGGFSAATSMIIIATLALSTMISNDVIMPGLLRSSKRQGLPHDYSLLILLVRRSMVVLVMLLSYLYYRMFARNYELAETGLLAFALVIQLAPAVIGGLYWRRGNAWGVYLGLTTGCVLWFYTLMLPQLVSTGAIDSNIMQTGLFGWSWLVPTALFGTSLDSLSHGVLFSTGFNLLFYLAGSLFTQVSLQDRLQAVAFVKPNLPVNHQDTPARRIRIRNTDLKILLERFVGANRAAECLQEYGKKQQQSLQLDDYPSVGLVEHVERELAGVIGASSAAAMVNAVLEGRQLGFEDVVTLFDDTTQAIQFSRKILFSTLEHLSQGVSVVDRELKLVAWNKAYLEMFAYPEAMVRVGRPVADIVRFNAERGLCGPGSADEHVEKRIQHMQKGTAHVFQRVRPDGKVIEMRGNPIPGGGFVTSFTDISDHVQAVQALAEAKQHLEDRVQERTQTISEINHELLAEVRRRRETEQQLLQAKAEAEVANASKTRFLALASHDILQPLNAARLFTAALGGSKDVQQQQHIISQLDNSLKASEELISTLLEIAKLDDGKLTPDVQAVSLQELLSQLADEFGLLAQQKGLQFTVRPADYMVNTDATYLRRILQNMLSNAIKYTKQGRILLGCRKRGEQLLIQVWDSGPGIAEPDLLRIFEDFYRIDATAKGQQGVGLGLGVVNRMAKLLGHPLNVQSWPGKGSMFSISLPLVSATMRQSLPLPGHSAQRPVPGLSVVCIDDDAANLAALKVLLQQWQITDVACFYDDDSLMDYARTHPAPDVLLIDYQLGQQLDGLSLYNRVKLVWGAVHGILVSASPEAGLAMKAKQQGLMFLAKPIKPAALRASLSHLKMLKRAQQ